MGNNGRDRLEGGGGASVIKGSYNKSDAQKLYIQQFCKAFER
jgi:hypothetical protein